ncbi:hypothetical protein [Loktanella sp. Alg231-35]|uniref:hypothetical protein n=1 Tax=Loktanella sp. Alg231-35 TaxID=1922220 RepID=UPI000D54C98B|nr:hypothetical protein [Loktanella sp. Alg231-35]
MSGSTSNAFPSIYDELMAQRTKKRQSRLVLVLGIFIALMCGAMAFPVLFLRQEVEVAVTRVDAPISCRERRSLIFGSRERSSVPQMRGFWCGHIMTDHGNLHLPATSRFPLFWTPREEMLAMLNAGCRYKVTVFGTGGDIAAVVGLSNRGKRNLLAVEPMGDCATF